MRCVSRAWPNRAGLVDFASNDRIQTASCGLWASGSPSFYKMGFSKNSAWVDAVPPFYEECRLSGVVAGQFRHQQHQL
jgi:hypothetical protein